MDTPSPSMRDLARRLLAANGSARSPQVHDAVVVCEALRAPLTRFAGADGFAALWRRALVLAGAEVPSLRSVKLGRDCRMEGLEHIDREAAAVVAGHLLTLLVTFIGEPFTLRIVREAWPDVSLDTLHSEKEVRS